MVFVRSDHGAGMREVQYRIGLGLKLQKLQFIALVGRGLGRILQFYLPGLNVAPLHKGFLYRTALTGLSLLLPLVAAFFLDHGHYA